MRLLIVLLAVIVPNLVLADPIPKAGWALLSVDSEETVKENGAAINAFDGSLTTIWHTEYSVNVAPLPHQISIDMGAYYDVTGFRYLPRRGGGNGTIASYQFDVSDDGQIWKQMATGTFVNDATEKEVANASITARYIRLSALSEINAGPWTTAAEITALTPAKFDATITISWPESPLTEEVIGYNVYYGLIKYTTTTPDIVLNARTDLALSDGVHKVCFQVTSIRGTEESARSNDVCAGFILVTGQIIVPLTQIKNFIINIK